MRKILFLLIASTFFTVEPVVVPNQAAEARGLFDTLFPRAAQRRRERERRRYEWEEQKRLEERRRKRRTAARPRIKKTGFKAYSATALSAVPLVKLAEAFGKREHELLAEAALRETAREATGEFDAFGPSPAPGAPIEMLPPTERPVEEEAALAGPILVSNETVSSIRSAEDLRLSAGADYLRDIKIKARPALGKAIVKHYSALPEFRWLEPDGTLNEAGEDLVAVLTDAEAWGLDPAAYALPLDTAPGEAPLLTAMKMEFALTAAALRYRADARNGIVNPNRISGYHDFKELAVAYDREIKQLITAKDVEAFLLAAHPQDTYFINLKKELQRLKGEVGKIKPIIIADGTFVKPGQTSDQLEAIVEGIRRKATAEVRTKHFDVLMVDHTDGVYGPEVVALVKDFQRSMKLGPDGIVGRKTIAKLRGDNPTARIDKVRYAMERRRWHPDTLGPTRVFINQAAYRATFYRGGAPKLSMKTVVGKPSNQTNFFYDEIEYVEFNPYWGVPQSIIVNEMLPKLRNNPGYLDNLGYEVTDSRGRRVSSWNVDWWGVGSRVPYDVRQPPGPKNALGRLKIMFPNKHSIYMHDTPAKSLFGRSTRAFSHGCVRLEDPTAMAAAVLNSSVQAINASIAGGANKRQNVPVKIPVYVSYFTAWPDEGGTVRYFADVYGRDRALGKAMKIEAAARQNAQGA